VHRRRQNDPHHHDRRQHLHQRQPAAAGGAAGAKFRRQRTAHPALTSASVAARHRSEAAALGEAKLTELIATGDWQYGATGGDFGEDWPDYHWTGASGNWPSDPSMTQLEVHITWTSRQDEHEVVLTTLIYSGQTGTSTGTGTGTGTGF